MSTISDFDNELNDIREKKILIVDDLPDNLRLLSSTLKERGYEVRCAKSGSMALMGVKAYNPDLILLDIKLPDLDGYSVCERLKADRETKDIPVIFLSALDEVFDKVRAFEVGGADYISKPFQIPEVLARIDHQLDLIAAKAKIRHLNAFLERKVEQRTAELQQEIIERISAQMMAKQAREKLESILNSLKEVVVSLDFYTRDILYLNPAAEQLYDRPLIEFFERPNLWLEVVYTEDRDRVEEYFSHLETLGSINIEYRIVRPSGEIRWVNDRRYSIADKEGGEIRIDGILNDITERKQIEQKLIYRALHDSLTGLPDRTLFVERLEIALDRIKSTVDYSFAVLFIDLDRFKEVNDTFGHLIGDRLLITVASLLKECLRANDTIARFGGDEFVVLLDGIDRLTEATKIADRIASELQSPFNLEGQNLSVTASIGIVVASSNYQSAAKLLADADLAMYRAKQSGGGCHQIFQPEIKNQTPLQLSLQAELALAFDRQEFLLYYQPIINILNRELIGFEALLRWQHPDRGCIAPADLIAMAEHTDIILPLGEWMLRQACDRLFAWQRRFEGLENLKMFVDVTGRQIREHNFIEQIDTILLETGLDGSYLQLEIPEITLNEQIEANITALKKLKNRQIKIAVDDFGASYSSLSYLHRLPIDALKISSSFVSNMDFNPEKVDIVRTLVNICHSLGKKAIATGVESEAQFSHLKTFRCEKAQGNFFCKPLNSTAVESCIVGNCLFT